MLNKESIPGHILRASRSSRPKAWMEGRTSNFVMHPHRIFALESAPPSHFQVVRSSSTSNTTDLSLDAWRPVHTPEAFSLSLLSSYNEEIVLEMCGCRSRLTSALHRGCTSLHNVFCVECDRVDKAYPSHSTLSAPAESISTWKMVGQFKSYLRGEEKFAMFRELGIRFSASAFCVRTAGILGWRKGIVKDEHCITLGNIGFPLYIWLSRLLIMFTIL